MINNKTLKTTEYSYTVIYESVKEGGYRVTVPLLPGLITYGRNFEEARKMAKDAIQCHIESLVKEKERVPNETALVEEKITIRL